nr:hypothetical protein [Rhizobium deserti]
MDVSPSAISKSVSRFEERLQFSAVPSHDAVAPDYRRWEAVLSPLQLDPCRTGSGRGGAQAAFCSLRCRPRSGD